MTTETLEEKAVETAAPFYFTCKKLSLTLLSTSCENSRGRKEKSVGGISRSTSCYRCKEFEEQQQNERRTVEDYNSQVAATLMPVTAKYQPSFRNLGRN